MPSSRFCAWTALVFVPLASSLVPLQSFDPKRHRAPLATKSTVSGAPAPVTPTKTYTVFIDAEDSGTATHSKDPQDDYYWKEAKIHLLGNTGFLGRLHALVAPLATLLIDATSYGGRNVRKEVHEQLEGAGTVLDLCCGVGMSTAPNAVGVDAAQAMIDAARVYHPGRTFRVGNAENYGQSYSYDVVTVMFAMHEMPRAARRSVLRNAARVARKWVIVVDIDPKYKLKFLNDPIRKSQAEAFLSGEPYVEDYLKNVDRDIRDFARMRGWNVKSKPLLREHVVSWRLERNVFLYSPVGAAGFGI